MKILSLGAGGFIGAHLTERLLKEGHDVTAVDIHTDKISEFLGHPKLTFIEKDIRNIHKEIDKWVKDSDLVIDLIAYANPGMYVRQPLEVFKLNFTENLRFAEACVRHQKRLIQFSTCEVYGRTVVAILNGKIPDPENPEYATFSEDTTALIMGPVSKHRWIYASAKQLLERVLHAYGLEGQLNYSIIRPFNFIGPKIDYLPGEMPDGIPRVFSYFMEALLKGTVMKMVDGGQQRRCYCYITDAVDCMYRIIQNPGGVCDRQIFNIGTPRNETSIRNFGELMLDIYSKKYKKPGIPLPKIVEVSGDEFYGKGYEDSDRRIPDNAKVRNLLGWDAKYNMRQMLEMTMDYYVKKAQAT